MWKGSVGAPGGGAAGGRAGDAPDAEAPQNRGQLLAVLDTISSLITRSVMIWPAISARMRRRAFGLKRDGVSLARLTLAREPVCG